MLGLAELGRAVAALDRAGRGARVIRVRDAGRDALALDLAGGDGHPGHARWRLVLSWRPGFARLSEAVREEGAAPGEGRGAGATPGPAVRFLRPRLAGASLVTAAVRGGDRQASLRFAAGAPPWTRSARACSPTRTPGGRPPSSSARGSS